MNRSITVQRRKFLFELNHVRFLQERIVIQKKICIGLTLRERGDINYLFLSSRGHITLLIRTKKNSQVLQEYLNMSERKTSKHAISKDINFRLTHLKLLTV